MSRRVDAGMAGYLTHGETMESRRRRMDDMSHRPVHMRRVRPKHPTRYWSVDGRLLTTWQLVRYMTCLVLTLFCFWLAFVMIAAVCGY